MTQRHLFYAPQMSELGRAQIWNHPQPDPCLHLENGSFVRPTIDVANTALRQNEYSSATFSLGFPNYLAANPGSSNGPFQHPSRTASSSHFPADQSQQIPPPCFNQLAIRDGSSTVNPQVDIGRAGSKRKSPATTLAFDRRNSNGYYCAGSSSNLHISSDHLHPKPMSVPQYWPVDPTRMGPSYRSDNLVSAGEASQRNVRSRHSHAPQIESNPSGVCPPANPPPHFYATGNSLSMAGQWSHNSAPVAPHRRIPSSGSNVINASMGISSVYHSNPTQNRNQTAALPMLHGLSMQGTGAAHGSHSQRSTSYRVNSSYGFAATSLEDGRLSVTEVAAPSIRSRPLSNIGRSSNRNRRLRNSHGRFQSVYDEDSVHSIWLSEGPVMMDGLAFYDSRDLFDQHRDMRLDIDNMSYEELLALEERIGYVSTGLSDDSICGYLVETIHCSSDQVQDDQEEEKCVVCLEGYKDRDRLGKLNCGHDFHVDCIRNWLQIKNVCPICKADVSKDTTEK